MTYWTEAAITAELGNSLFRLEVDFNGVTRVVDANSGDVKIKLQRMWTKEELEQLVVYKRRGMTNFQIAELMDRDVGCVNHKWRARNLWKDVAFVPRQEVVTLADLSRTVCAVCNVTKEDFVSERRFKPAVEARQIFYWLARYYNSTSLPQIGRYVGRRDHSTVQHGVRKVDAEIDRFRTKIDLCLFDLGLTEPKQEAA